MSAEFTLGRPGIGLGNSDYFNAKSFAECDVAVGPFRFSVYVAPDGTCSIPATLRDEALRAKIAAAVRVKVIEELADRWAAVNAREAKRLIGVTR